MAKQRASKYDKKVKLNVSFHDAVNILMNKSVKSPNNMTIEIGRNWQDIGIHILENNGIKVLCMDSNIECKINNATGNEIIIPSQHGITTHIKKAAIAHIQPAFLYLRVVGSDSAEVNVEFCE